MVSRRRSGAVNAPATAPTDAAKPQPIIKIFDTGTPTKPDDSGLEATARMARPSFVFEKSSQNTTASIPNVSKDPSVCHVTDTPKIDADPSPNNPGNDRVSAPQISCAKALIPRNSPIVMITT